MIECDVSPVGSCVRTRGPQFVVLFLEIMNSLGHEALLGLWGRPRRLYPPLTLVHILCLLSTFTVQLALSSSHHKASPCLPSRHAFPAMTNRFLFTVNYPSSLRLLLSDIWSWKRETQLIIPNHIGAPWNAGLLTVIPKSEPVQTVYCIPRTRLSSNHSLLFPHLLVNYMLPRCLPPSHRAHTALLPSSLWDLYVTDSDFSCSSVHPPLCLNRFTHTQNSLNFP